MAGFADRLAQAVEAKGNPVLVGLDPRLAQFTLPEERLLAAAALHSRHRHIALVAEASPRLSWRRIAKQFRKSLVHVPLAKFSSETVQLLRQVHVLDDKQVRSWADAYIRRP